MTTKVLTTGPRLVYRLRAAFLHPANHDRTLELVRNWTRSGTSSWCGVVDLQIGGVDGQALPPLPGPQIAHDRGED